MFRLLTTAAIVFASGSIAAAYTIEHDLIINPGGQALLGPDYVTFDLVVTITGADWILSSAEATLADGTFWIQSPLGNGADPQFHFWGYFPDMEYSCFYTPAAPGWTSAGFVENVQAPNYRRAEWFTTPPFGGEGTFVIARYTIFAPDWDGTYSLGSLTGYSELDVLVPVPHEFALEFIPAPGSLALLGLAGLIGRRGR